MVLTRTPADNARLRAAIEGVDAEVIDYPCITIERVPLAAEIRERLQRGDYATVFFVSRNAVESLLAQVTCAEPKYVIALGSGTADALSARGWKTTAYSTKARMESVLRELDQLVPREGRVLYVRGELGADALPQALRARGQDVDSAIVYGTRDAVSTALVTDDRPTLTTFASPSAVRHFVAHNPAGGHAITIGETTAQAARDAGFSVTVAPSSDTQALAACVREWAARYQGEVHA